MALMIGDQIRYAGCVLCTRERNWYGDSDFYAMVWDEETQAVEEVVYDTTRFAGGGNAIVDATAEVKEKAAQYIENKLLDALIREDETQSGYVRIGRTVKVMKGYKVPVGTVGEVFWIGDDNYGKRKVGIDISGRKNEKGYRLDVQWTALSNVMVIGPEQYITDHEVLRERAKKFRYDYSFFSRKHSASLGMIVA